LGLPSTAYYNTTGGVSNVLQAYEKYMIRLAQLLHRSEQLYRKQSKYASLLRQRQQQTGSTNQTSAASNIELKLSERLMKLKSVYDSDSAHAVEPEDLMNYEQVLLDEFEADKEIERQMKLVLHFEIELANVSRLVQTDPQVVFRLRF
jgi:anti-sigma28 factor (negative regulator of flagellin synthesis)